MRLDNNFRIKEHHSIEDRIVQNLKKDLIGQNMKEDLKGLNLKGDQIELNLKRDQIGVNLKRDQIELNMIEDLNVLNLKKDQIDLKYQTDVILKADLLIKQDLVQFQKEDLMLIKDYIQIIDSTIKVIIMKDCHNKDLDKDKKENTNMKVDQDREINWRKEVVMVKIDFKM